MVSVNICGKDIPLVYKLRTQAEIEEIFDGETNIPKLIKKGKKQTANTVSILKAFAKSAGTVLDEDWIWENLKPAMYSTVYLAITQAYFDGMQFEHEESKEVDLGLQEIKKNKVNSDSEK